MRKIFIVTTTLMILFISQAHSQFAITFGNATDVVPGENATIDVNVSGFQNILGVQFSINYDSLVLGYVNATNFQGSLPGLNAQSVSGPNGVGVKNGQITFSWFSGDGNGKTLPNGTRLFSIVLKANGAACSTSDIIASNTPRIIEISNGNLEPVPFSFVKGNVKIKCPPGPGSDPCPNPICANPNNLTLSGTTIIAAPGSTVCVPFTVTNFKDLQSGQGTFTWNSTELQYIEHKIPATGALGATDLSFNSTNTANGQLGFLWSNPTPGVPLTLPNGTKIIELCFKVLASAPDTVCVLLGQGTIPSEWSNNAGEVQTCIKYGKVIVGVVPPPGDVTITINDAEGMKDQIVCVGITVNKFTNISNLMTRFQYNPAELELVRTDMYSLDGLDSNKFNSPSPGILNLSWTSPAGTTKPDGFKIFQICFKLLGPCPGSANITFAPGITEVSALINGAPTTITSVTVPGKITCTFVDPVMPMITCTQGVTVNVTCNGLSNGSTNINITGTKLEECVIEWKDSNNTIIKPAAAISAGTNIANLPAGTYMYTVRWTFDNKILCSGMVTITQPTAINIPTANVVTNPSCGNKGSINLSGTSGGTSPYTYTWTPNLGNTANPTNLDAGQYIVNVSDANGCTAGPQSFTVGTALTPLLVTVTTLSNVKCNGGSDGAISIVPSGGCMPHTVIISGGSATGLKAGTYTVTVTDVNGSTTGTAIVTEPTPIVVTDPIVVGSNAGSNNGSITLNISGGTPIYNVTFVPVLAGGNTSGAFTTNNVPAGTYTATITDANGCIVSKANIVVPTKMDTVIKPEIKSAAAAAGFNGFGVSCFGDSNGSITVQFGGTLPMTAQLISNGQNVGAAQTISTGSSYTFTNVKAGTYTFTLTNTAGVATSQSIEVKQPTKLVVSNTVTCTEEGKSTGTISLNAGGGVSPYIYVWSNSATTANLKELSRGVYTVTVKDTNGCTSTLTNIEIINCDDGPTDCYIADKIITPNGDNFNDKFRINCVEKASGDLAIYDRYGKLVYTQLEYDNTWSGVAEDGKDLDEGGYIWVLTNRLGLGNKEIYKGVVTILR